MVWPSCTLGLAANLPLSSPGAQEMISGLAPGLLFNDLKDHKEPVFPLCRFSFSNLIAIRREIFLKRKKKKKRLLLSRALIKLSHRAYYWASGLREAC